MLPVTADWGLVPDFLIASTAYWKAQQSATTDQIMEGGDDIYKNWCLAEFLTASESWKGMYIYIWVILLKTGPKRVPLSQWNKMKNKKLFKLLLYFWCNVFGEIREMPQCVNALFLVLWDFFGKKRDIFMAAICDMALGRLDDHRYFLGIIHDWIKTGFMRKKEASSYIQMVFIVCCLLLTASNKGKIISVSHVTDGVFWVFIVILWLVHNRNWRIFLFSSAW